MPDLPLFLLPVSFPVREATSSSSRLMPVPVQIAAGVWLGMRASISSTRSPFGVSIASTSMRAFRPMASATSFPILPKSSSSSGLSRSGKQRTILQS